MKEKSMFTNCGLTLAQVENIYNKYGIIFVCEGDNLEYYIESEVDWFMNRQHKRTHGLVHQCSKQKRLHKEALNV